MTRAVESIEVALNAKRYRCFYAVRSSSVSVWRADFSSLTAPLSGLAAPEHRDALTRYLIWRRRVQLSADAMTAR